MRHNRLSIQSGEQIHCRPLLCPEVLCSSPGVYYFCQRYNSSLSPQIFYVLLINFDDKIDKWDKYRQFVKLEELADVVSKIIFIYIYIHMYTNVCYSFNHVVCTFECLFCTKLFFHYYFTINQKNIKKIKQIINMCTRIDIFQLISS